MMVDRIGQLWKVGDSVLKTALNRLLASKRMSNPVASGYFYG